MATIPIQGLMKNVDHYYIYNLNLKLFQMVLWKITRGKNLDSNLYLTPISYATLDAFTFLIYFL